MKFVYGAYGKPGLVSDVGRAIHFSLSRSGGLGLYALTRIGEIGIDLERVRSGLAYEAMAEQFLCKEDVLALRALAAEARPAAFLAHWTRLEAYLKGRGLGLAQGLDHSAQPVLAGGAVADGWNQALGWRLHRVLPAPEFIGAIAVPRKAWRQVYWRWEAPGIPSRQVQHAFGRFEHDLRLGA